MSDPKESKTYDPFEAWRGMRDASMGAWAKVMTEAVNTESYAQSTGALLDTYLTASAPFYEMMQKAITQALQELNLPSRDDFANLSGRLTNIEVRLDDMDAKLDRQFAKTAEPASPKTARKEAK